MEYVELSARLAGFSFLGIIASGVLCHWLGNIERRRGFPFTERFWTEFKIGTWVLFIAFFIGIDVWLLSEIVKWLKS